MSKYRPTGNTNRTLTDAQVMFFRGEYFANPPRITTREIMEQTELSMVSVRRMLNGETYRHIGIAPLQQLKDRRADESARDVRGDTMEESMRRMAAANNIPLPAQAPSADEVAAKSVLGGLTAAPEDPNPEDMLNELYGR